MAVSITLPSAFMAWLAAPVPRPPQPINPTRIVSSLAAKVLVLAKIAGAIALAASADEEWRRNSRRLEVLESSCAAGKAFGEGFESVIGCVNPMN